MSDELSKFPSESLFEYELRLGQNKDTYGIGWSEIASLLNSASGDNEFTESKWRKEIQNFMTAYNEFVKHDIGTEKLLEQEQKILEQRKMLQVYTNLRHKDARITGRQDLITDELVEKWNKLEVPSPRFSPSLSSPKQSHVLSVGDIHFGKFGESLNNSYSEEKAINRMNQVLSETVEFIEDHKSDHIDLITGGDDIDGMLRISQLQAIQDGYIDQTIKFSRFYASWLNEFSKYTNLNVHFLTSANHSEIRPFNTKRGQFPGEDLEKVIAAYTHDVLINNDRIKFNTYKDGFAEFNVQGYNICSLHGHQVKKDKNIINRLSALHRKFYDYCFMFHFHYEGLDTLGSGVDNNIQLIQCPSVCGSDGYSDGLLTSAMPSALITTFTQGKGKTDTHEIILK
jgi:hypothetical protein